MYEQKFIDFLLENNINVNLMVENDEAEAIKLRDVIKDCMLIDTKTLTALEAGFKDLKGGHSIFYAQTNDDYLIYQKDICMADPKRFTHAQTCKECTISAMRLCVYNNMYKRGWRYVKRK